MRSAGNFSPEWGYLAPAPSFARTARIVLVATAIGATAGAGVVLSLVDRSPEPERTPVATRAIVTSVQAAAPAAREMSAAAPAAAPVSPPAMPSASSPVTAPATTSEASAQLPNQSQAPTIKPPDQPTAVPSTEANASAQTPAPVTPAENGAPTNAGPTPAASVAALSEPSATGTAADAANGGTVSQDAAQKKAKHHAYNDRGPFPGLGTLFRRFFVAHAGRPNYSNR